MIREMSLAEVRKNFTDIINEVRYRHDRIILKKGNKSVAVIIDVESFEKLKSLSLQTNDSNDPNSQSIQNNESTQRDELETEAQDESED